MSQKSSTVAFIGPNKRNHFNDYPRN